ncbi:MAG: Xaa-Pro peptidase family protein [Actinomycetota bacterium]|nr:Xaa-Pro peptidase family protein [Actinomycetota bacterium]
MSLAASLLHRPFAGQEYADRRAATRELMAQSGLSTLCLVGPENIYYLTGLNHQGYFAFTMLVLPLDGPAVLITRAMERATVAAQTPDCSHVSFQDGADPAVVAADTIRDVTAAGGRIAVEMASTYLSAADWQLLRGALGDAPVLDGSGLVESLRAVKSETEIYHLRRAAAISDVAMQAGIAATHPGVNERDVAAAVYDAMIRAGGEYPGFVPLVRSRDILLQEHVTWRDHVVAADEALFLELSGVSARYHAPCSRMVYLGSAPPGTDVAAGIAGDGLAAVCDALQPGAIAAEVYAAWQKVVDKGLGHGRYRRHHCGYSTGIGFPPSWVGGSAVVGLRHDSDLPIKAGMVFHVLSWILGQEPPDYVLSDTVLVTDAGGELLTTTDRTPIVKDN